MTFKMKLLLASVVLATLGSGILFLIAIEYEGIQNLNWRIAGCLALILYPGVASVVLVVLIRTKINEFLLTFVDEVDVQKKVDEVRKEMRLLWATEEKLQREGFQTHNGAIRAKNSEIYATLTRMNREAKLFGYGPETHVTDPR